MPPSVSLADVIAWWRGKADDLAGVGAAARSTAGEERDDDGEEGDDEPWGYGDGRDSYASPRRNSAREGPGGGAAGLRRTVGKMDGWFRNIAEQSEGGEG